ncbi:sigma-54-dependent transcriptional regulator [Methylobrevis pamukkalensis]|uniref:Luminescence regulatory protein LuxO n=1 Tax=Methylobrevis pamukkalensis TaxID=1439726 RepID=A0A1E3H6G2_9HYPH|nr:sigma-54 dependent transcriptional regulator [Methylobrevis pamukkalensis]ODN71725.1 Luminescence regulatory protein LuxO [Methylobrevis pamukkalensis]
MGGSPRPSSALRVLVVDRDPEARFILKRALEQRIARPLMILETAATEAARLLLAEQAFDVLTLDLDTVGGLSGFREVHAAARATLVYASGEAHRVSDAVAAVREGAADYLEKPLDGPAFARRIERHFVVAEAIVPGDIGGLVGRSARMRNLFDQIARIAPAAAPVFISGESGTGKKLCARAVHARSRRADGPFIVVDCGSLGRDDLMLAIAGGDGNGALRRAHGGSLLLDEVGDLDPAIQTLLVRFIETGDVIGPSFDVEPVQADVRLMATTGRVPDDLVRRGAMRPDLFYRLNVLSLHLPPLRERPEDIVPIAETVLKRCADRFGTRLSRFAPAAEKLIAGHPWPGNVRELENLVQRIATLNDGEVVTAEMLADAGFGMRRAPASMQSAVERARLPDGGNAPADNAAARIRPLWMAEAQIIEEAIEAFDGNIARAAAALEISPSTIYRKRRGGAAPTRDDLPSIRFG